MHGNALKIVILHCFEWQLLLFGELKLKLEIRKNMELIFANCSGGTHGKTCTFVAASDIKKNRLVTFVNGKVKLSAANENPFGISLDEVSAGERVAVQFIGGNETVLLESLGAIAPGSIPVLAAEGNVTTTPATDGTYLQIGIAIGSSTGTGDFVEILPFSMPFATVVVAE
jgi:hypothetical protein